MIFIWWQVVYTWAMLNVTHVIVFSGYVYLSLESSRADNTSIVAK